MPKASLTPEDIRMLADALRPAPVAPAAPVAVVQDKDTFATFTGGLRQNWTFVLAIFGIGFWLISNVFSINSKDSQQDARISSVEEAVVKLEVAISNGETSQNEVIRRLDNLQKDIEIIKTSNP